jgi:sphingolipid 4-desaturase/C4-monooxygenase
MPGVFFDRNDVTDVDIPTVFETKLFRHWTTKLFWLSIHPIIHAIRPFYKSPIPILGLEVVNFFVQITFDLFILYFFGIRSFTYLILGTLLGLGLHPLAGHFISEHYLFWNGQATANYHGPLNYLIYNLGYHIEHHDFPYIPYRRLPELKRIAPEFYQEVPYHTSWCKVLWDFIFRDDMGPHARGIGYLPQGMNQDDVEMISKEIREGNNNKNKKLS